MLTIIKKEFKSKSFSFWIHDNKGIIIIQAGKTSQVFAESTFSIEQLKIISPYFSLFSNIAEISKDLISLAESNRIECQEALESYDLFLNINLKNINKIKLQITKKPQSLYEGNKIEAIERKITQRLDSIEDQLKKQMTLLQKVMTRLDKVEGRTNCTYASSCDIEPRSNSRFCETEAKSDKGLRSMIKVKMPNRTESPYVKRPFKKAQMLKQKLQKKAVPKQLGSPINSLKRIEEPLGFLTNEEKAMVLNWVGNASVKPVDYKLLFHPSKGEDKEEKCIQAFYQKFPLLVLIRTDKGCRFGGYTSVGWDLPPETKYQWKYDSKAFLFSIDLKKQYPIKEDLQHRAIFCKKGDIAAFCYGITLMEDFLTSNENWTDLYHYGRGEPQYEHNDNVETFTVDSLYVYQILTA